MPSNDPTGDRGGPRPPDHQRFVPARPAGDLVAPAKAIRLLETLRAGLGELNRVHLDDAARRRVIAAHRAALIEVASTVSDALIDELVALRAEPLDRDASVAQIKVAQAQILGWVNGVIVADAMFGTPTQVDAAPLDDPKVSHGAR